MENSRGYDYNPEMIPFHKSDLIPQELIKDYGNKGYWWKKELKTQ